MAPRLRPYEFYDTAVSICSHCFRRVDGKIVFQDGGVWMLKRCAIHGPERVLLADDIAYYRRAREIFVKAPEQVAKYNTKAEFGCPYDCGICPDHEQHGCNVLIEVTDNCNLRCPTCYASSGPERLTHRSMEQIEAMLDRACANEVEPDIVQISGGEPTIHPQFFEILDAAKRRPIKHLMVNTNGLKIAEDPEFARRLKTYEPNFELYLQFDSFRRDALMTLRAADLRRVHEQAMANLNAANVATTLVVTVRRGVNDDELGEIVDYAVKQPCVRGVTFQPVQMAGRLDEYEGGYTPVRDRLTLTEVRRRILQQCDVFEPEDIIPVPCHADSLAMAYAMKFNDSVVPLTSLVDPQLLIEGGRNTMLYEQETTVRNTLFELFSTHHSLESRDSALSEFLTASKAKRPAAPTESPDRADIDPPAADPVAAGFGYHNVFRLLIIEFIDAHSFDLRSIRKTCVHIVTPDAKRVVPFDTYNMMYRDDLEETIVAPIRAERQAAMGIGGPLSVKSGGRHGQRSLPVLMDS